MDSTGLACLLVMSKDGLPVRFIRGPATPHKIFEITATTDLLEWTDLEE